MTNETAQTRKPEALFDVYSTSLVQVEENEYLGPTFMMRAPMRVIEQVLDMGSEATRRVLQELKSAPVAEIHHNRRGPWALVKHAVQPAVGTLGTER